MNWLTDYVKPKLQALVTSREVPDNLWRKCDNCGQMIFHRDFKQALFVCPSCNHHHHISAHERLDNLFSGSWQNIPYPTPATDPLGFRDSKRYTDRLKEARQKTGLQDSILLGRGFIKSHEALCLVHEFAFMGGSMGIAVGNAFLEAAQQAIKHRLPVIVFSAAGGARMQEGIFSLMQMPRTTVAVNQIKKAGLPFIVVLTNPTTGGVTASYAMLGDIHIAEPKALICFTGPRVIQQTIKAKLPDGFQSSEYLLEHGMIDMIVHRADMAERLATLLSLLTVRMV